jgi:phosphatidylglycerol---prolipoprotein diacylglyceryl transferase
MLLHPQFNPVAFQFGIFTVRWYALMFVFALLLAVALARRRLRLPHIAAQGWRLEDSDELLIYGLLGGIIGARLGYVLFYNPSFYFAHPLDIFKVWQGGLSFHGGLLGAAVVICLFARRYARSVLQVADFAAPLVPTGIAAGRLGNFINGELWGRVSSPDMPWAMLFPQAAAQDHAWIIANAGQVPQGLQTIFDHYQLLPRHPSQLYEIVLEGIMLFIVVWLFSRKPRPTGAVIAVFFITYSCARFIVEFTRAPDSQLGLLALGLSMGQWLSLPIIIAGIALLAYAYRHRFDHRRSC